MDVFFVLETSIITTLVMLFALAITTRFLLPRLRDRFNSSINWRIDNVILPKVVEFVNLQLENIREHPEQLANLLEKPMDLVVAKFTKHAYEHPDQIAELLKKPAQLLMDNFTKDIPKGAVEALTGKAGSGIADAAGSFVPKKYRPLLGFLQMFLSRGEGSTGNTSTKNPFE